LLTPAGLPTYRITSGSLSRATRSSSSDGRRRRSRSRGVSIMISFLHFCTGHLPPQRNDDVYKEAAMRRTIALGSALLVLVALSSVAPADAQTKDDTVVYALQSDIPNWDPPNSVLRESIILGYNVFDHLAARDLKTGKVGPSLATSWRSLDDTTW